jgi:hypothetical protein
VVADVQVVAAAGPLDPREEARRVGRLREVAQPVEEVRLVVAVEPLAVEARAGDRRGLLVLQRLAEQRDRLLQLSAVAVAQRVAPAGRPFLVAKFRTMVTPPRATTGSVAGESAQHPTPPLPSSRPLRAERLRR